MLTGMSRNLVVAPHHDDEVIGCGGTIAFLTANGHSVDVIYMAAGYASMPKVGDRAKATATREREARKAGSILGVSEQIFLRYPDRGFDYSSECVEQLVRLIREHDYETIYCPHEGERDREHRVAYEIVREAFWLANSEYVPDLGRRASVNRVFTYEVWTPLQTVVFKQDISSSWERKLEALCAYASQFTLQQAEGIVGLNRYRAAMSSRTTLAVEAFGLCVR